MFTDERIEQGVLEVVRTCFRRRVSWAIGREARFTEDLYAFPNDLVFLQSALDDEFLGMYVPNYPWERLPTVGALIDYLVSVAHELADAAAK